MACYTASLMTRVHAALSVILGVLLVVSCSSVPTVPETGPITLGLVADLSSSGAADGNDVLKGIELFLKETNAAGGVDGRQLRLHVIDTKQNPADVVKAYTTLAQDEGVSAVIGSTPGPSGLAVSPVADLVRVPLVSLGIDDRITTPEVVPGGQVGARRQYMFMVRASAGQVATGMALFAAERFVMRRVAVLYDPGDAVSLLQAQSFAAAAHRTGLTVTGLVDLPPSGSDYTPALAKVSAMGVDAVFVCGSAEENAAVAARVARTSFRPALLGNQAWDPGPAGTSGAPDGTWFCTGISPDDQALALLGERFTAEFGTTIRPAVLPGYDAAALVVTALRRAGSSNAQKLRDALEQVSRFPSTRGPLNMDRATHRFLSPPVAVMRIVGGRAVTVEQRYVPRAR
jgi:branched-chain amino acid transport system substrate-binding protein